VTTILATENLEVTYAGGNRALQRTNLSIHAGEFVVLLGASGAGKSTLLRSLNRLVAPTVGRVIHPASRFGGTAGAPCDRASNR
jgi:phosphonate transport system ATP-binding protein